MSLIAIFFHLEFILHFTLALLLTIAEVSVLIWLVHRNHLGIQ